MTDPANAAAPAVPGKTLGIVGLVLAFLAPLIGAIISGVALSQSKKAGYPNGIAKAGLILGIVFTILWIIIGIVSVVLAATLTTSMIGTLTEVCEIYGPGDWVIDGVTYNCS